ncbi:Separase [Handroanthus impetiginosus]|uniref:separase n=1 Tax=Handroanthus impetiginosus TaxID=429701 RepID=A0A2G9GZM7_9LAMI|nr:Separase [Handroanthus impetiginosus]
MGCDSTAEATLLSKLQSSSDLIGIHRLFTAHLHPFTPFFKTSATTAKKPVKCSKSRVPDNTLPIRTLAKQFLTFIHKSLSLLPKRLSESPKIPHDSALELFDIYRLCLDCLEVIAPELAGKPHAVQIQRIRYIHCLEQWELYNGAEAEGFVVLESLNAIVRGGAKVRSRKSKARLVPELNEESVDREVAPIILEVVVTLVKCASKRRSKVEADYWRVISLVDESEPWFKILDAKGYGKFHHFLETNLHIIALFLVTEIKSFGLNLIREFSLVTFKEYKKSSAQDQMYKLGLKMCSSLFCQRDELSSDLVFDVLEHVLGFMAAECKVGVEETTLAFLELVCYCANKCHSATVSLGGRLAKYLCRIAGDSHEDFPFISYILKLYATGLLASSSNNQSKGEDTTNCRNAPLGSSLQVLLHKELIQQLAESIKLLKDHFDIGGKEKNSHKKGALPSHWEALKFFCQSFAESIYLNRKEIFSEAEGKSSWDDLSSICDVFHHFCKIFLRCLSAIERERETSGDNYRVISTVVVAAFLLSFRTNQNIKESTRLVKDVVSTEWAPDKRLKYLYVSLNNIAALLNRKKRLKEAIKALKLCCKASWNYVVDLCKMHVDESHLPHDDLSEKAIADFVKEASDKVAFLLELNQEGNCKINGIITESLKCWSVAENLIESLPIPASLVKEWVKIQYSLSKDIGTEHDTTLYSLLSSSKDISTRALGKLLEEELLAYDEKSYLNPRYSLKMRMKIMSALLEDVYVSKDSNLKKSKLLIEKGKLLRGHGLARQDECFQCLSDVISTLKSIYTTRKSCCSQVHHLLMQAYILHALCTQEAAASSMVLSPKSDFLQDIRAALKLCLSPNHGHADEHYEDMLYLWYQLIDLLSIKGYLEFHPSLYDVVIKLFNEKNFPLAKTMSQLWKSRRLSHALCASPINHIFIEIFSKHQTQPFDSAEFWRTCMDELKPLVVGFHPSNNEIKQAASDLISHVPLSSSSIFLSSYLYYNLAERLISSGQMIEALTYAKEAHRLRSKLLQQKFEYSVEKITQTFVENGESIEKSYYGIQTFKVNDFVVTKGSCDYEGCVLTPWNVLSCYLESILQVGIVQEILGNVSEAEMLLQWGRNVSQFQGLPLFEISFSNMLGKLYRKQKLWSIAEKELSSAKKILTDNLDIISCNKCSCMLQISINQQLGDLCLSSSCRTGESSTKKLFSAKSLYKSALDKLNLSDWRTSTSYMNSGEAAGEQVIARERSVCSCAINPLEINGTLSNDKSETKIEHRRSRRTKKELKPAAQRQNMLCDHNRRITRSTRHSSGQTLEIVPGDKHIGSTIAADDSDHMPNFESKCSTADFQSDITSLCNKMKCWHCVHIEAVDCSSLSNFIYISWELVHRKLCLRLLVSIGKLFGICGNVHEAHEILLQSISVLFGRNTYCSKYSSDSLVSLFESIGKHFPGDGLAVERAALLYYISWFALKSYPSQGTRKFHSELLCIGTERIVSLLKLSFILCREVPSLFQKISRLLAAIYILSTWFEHFSLPPRGEGSESRWASFFHQASLGTHLNQQLFSGMVQKKQGQIATDPEDYLLPCSVSTVQDVPGFLRLAPESCDDLEEFVLRFFQGLPSTPVVCISLVAGDDASLLRELMQSSPTVRAWILLSHLSSDNQHVILLPIYKTLEASGDDAGSSSVVFNCKDFVKQWQCPWVSSWIDDIAPVFRHVLEGNYYSSSEYFLDYIKENTSLWWMQRNRLDECLSKFLQDVEELWLGTWKYLLLGQWPDCSYLNSTKKDLSEDEGHLLQLVLTKKCYVGVGSEASSSEFENTMQLLFKSMHEVYDNFDQDECMNRNPIILVLDSEVQMLPWENLPILRNQEVYRMPSIHSIFTTLDRCCRNQEKVETSIPAFPLIDPLDSYYLLNPDGDLSRTQVEFENWFKDQNMEGKIGTVPTIGELTLALKSHDLFIYFGHGSGTQYIPGHEIQKLDSCAATLLLGCSSGSLYLKGCYMPQGAPISYLLAGSPVIVANLWEVTDKDIDRFGKAMLNGWLRERSAASECAQCKVPLNSRKSTKCSHRPRIGSFMGQARDACTLGFLIGAAPVCYGVPTGIIKRKNV